MVNLCPVPFSRARISSKQFPLTHPWLAAKRLQIGACQCISAANNRLRRTAATVSGFVVKYKKRFLPMLYFQNYRTEWLDIWYRWLSRGDTKSKKYWNYLFIAGNNRDAQHNIIIGHLIYQSRVYVRPLTGVKDYLQPASSGKYAVSRRPTRLSVVGVHWQYCCWSLHMFSLLSVRYELKSYCFQVAYWP